MAPIKTNNPYASYFDFFSKTGKDAVTPEPPPSSGLTATGGILVIMRIVEHIIEHTFLMHQEHLM